MIESPTSQERPKSYFQQKLDADPVLAARCEEVAATIRVLTHAEEERWTADDYLFFKYQRM